MSPSEIATGAAEGAASSGAVLAVGAAAVVLAACGLERGAGTVVGATGEGTSGAGPAHEVKQANEAKASGATATPLERNRKRVSLCCA